MPIAVVDVELTEPIAPIAPTRENGQRYGAARVLVRLHTRPLGVIDIALDDDGVSAGACADAIWSALGSRCNEHLRADGLPELDRLDPAGLPAIAAPPCTEPRRAVLRDPPSATVMICTRNRPALLRRSLRSLQELDYPDVELMVVDGSPGPETADLVRREFPDVTYLHVGQNRTAVARTRGTQAASGEFVASSDDDAVVDRNWLTELITGFGSDERVACVTGLVIPLELETPAQVWFEESGAFTAGFDRREISIEMATERGSLIPYATGKIGAGVSMAWRRSLLLEIGGYDAALDTLTPPWPLRARPRSAAQDLAAYFDALVNGYRIVYEPGAVVFHEHRRTYEELERQLYWHGIGLSAYLTRSLLTQPRRIPDFIRRIPSGVRWGFAHESPRNREKSENFPPGLTRAERRGVVAGPFAYLRGLPEGRRLRASERARQAS